MFESNSSVAPGRQVRRSGVKSKARRQSFRRLNGFEPLEKREVLSAYGFSEGLRVHANFDVAIRGTDVQFSELGLPASMGGDIYTAVGTAVGSSRIGHYQESLTPILMDINDDQIPDFVGTTGVATFDFFVGSSDKWNFGSITTNNISYIQGVTTEGQFVVGSQGTIVDGSRAFRHISGEFVSESTVGFVPTFEMQTYVHFSVDAPLKPTFVALVMAGLEQHGSTKGSKRVDQLVSEQTKSKRVDQLVSEQTESHHAPVALARSVDRLDESHQKPVGSRHKQSIDQNLELDVDWRMDEIIEAVGAGHS